MGLFAFKISRRLVTAFIVLSAISLIVALSSMLGINTITNSFKDLYSQRMMPAIVLGQITEQLYLHQTLVEEFPNTNQKAIVTNNIKVSSKRVDSLLNVFTHYMRIRGEMELIKAFEIDLKNYRKVESKFLASEVNAQEINFQPLDSAFQITVEPLHMLLAKEREAGLQLYQDAEAQATRIKVSSYVTLGIDLLLAAILAIYLSINLLNR